MWILTCDGDSLQGKRIWLRPGKKYLFGRTKPERGRHGFEILHKSVSRKHLTITVSNVRPESGSARGPRSHLTLQDENTKVGTIVDGSKLRNESITVHSDAHEFRLGSLEVVFRIVWEPVVLSFTFPSKDTRNGKDPLVPVRNRLEELDVQAIVPYDTHRTTHVVAAKRNTAKCLQALINGKYVVDHSFIDAIVYAATPGNLDEPESLSPLEEDFDKYWPVALDYVPNPSKEPGQRPSELFAPDSGRQNIFEDYIFIFCDQRQFENLLPPITNGGGKALQYEVEQGSTPPSQLVSYFREVSNKKHGNHPSGSPGQTVILIRFAGDKGHEDWANQMQTEVQSTLGVELVEQNEFLDVILTKDPRKLKRKLTARPTRPQAVQVSDVRNSNSASENRTTNGPPRLARPTGTLRSTFKGFDDGFDSFQIQSQAPNPKKRSPPSEDEDSSARDDALLPAAAAMKRRRLEEGSYNVPAPRSPEATNGTQKPTKREPKEIDIVQTVRERRIASDQAARAEELALQQSLSDMSFEEMNRLAQIEEMDVIERDASGRRAGAHNAPKSDRWDPRWNGRKNFKKFRRQGDKQDLRRGRQTVIVPLEEVTKRGRGIGEHYWLESTTSSSRYQRNNTRNHSEQDDEREDTASHSRQTFTSAPSHQEQQAAVPRELADLNEHQVIDVDEPRTTRAQQDQGHGTQQSKQPSGIMAGNKRAAALSARGGTAAAAKRQKTFAVMRGGDDDSDSEDELKFRIRRRNPQSSSHHS